MRLKLASKNIRQVMLLTRLQMFDRPCFGHYAENHVCLLRITLICTSCRIRRSGLVPDLRRIERERLVFRFGLVDDVKVKVI